MRASLCASCIGVLLFAPRTLQRRGLQLCKAAVVSWSTAPAPNGIQSLSPAAQVQGRIFIGLPVQIHHRHGTMQWQHGGVRYPTTSMARQASRAQRPRWKVLLVTSHKLRGNAVCMLGVHSKHAATHTLWCATMVLQGISWAIFRSHHQLLFNLASRQHHAP